MVLGYDPLRPDSELIQMLQREIERLRFLKLAHVKENARLRAALEEIKAGRSKDPQWDAIQALKGL